MKNKEDFLNKIIDDLPMAEFRGQMTKDEWKGWFEDAYNEGYKQAQALQLQQTGVIASCSNTYIGKEFVYTSRITNCKTIFKVARTDDRYGQTILISENKNRYFLDDVIPHN